MTEQEYGRLEVIIRGLWRNAKALTAPEHDVAFRLLEPVPFDAAADAVRRLAVDGREWPPPVGLIVNEAGRVPDDVTLDQALGLYRRALTRDHVEGRAAAMGWLVEQSPAVALFVTEVGFKQLGREHVDDPGHGGLVRDRLTRTLASCVVQQRRDPEHVRLLLAGRGTGERAGLRLVGGGRMVAQLQAMEDTA